MKFSRAFSRLGLTVVMLTSAVLSMPTTASAALIDYRAVISVRNSSGTTLGYVQEDPGYWTPLLAPTGASNLIVSFTLDGTTGTQVNLAPENSGQGYPYFGAVVGRDSTSSNIAAGSFNYLYLGGTNSTAPGATPQLPGSYFADTTGLSKASESAIWNIDVIAGTLLGQWINSDGSTPNTIFFIQSNHLYAGGDPGAFQGRFPAPTTAVTLHLDILSAVPQTEVVPEPTSMVLLGTGIVGLVVRMRRPRA